MELLEVARVLAVVQEPVVVRALEQEVPEPRRPERPQLADSQPPVSPLPQQPLVSPLQPAVRRRPLPEPREAAKPSR